MVKQNQAHANQASDVNGNGNTFNERLSSPHPSALTLPNARHTYLHQVGDVPHYLEGSKIRTHNCCGTENVGIFESKGRGWLSKPPTVALDQ